jgi:baculoviral IAP repeat-containing protein 6
LARRYEQNLPPEKRVKTAVITNRRHIVITEPGPISISMERLSTTVQNLDAVYAQIMQNYQIQTQKLVNDAGKPIYGFAFKKDLRNINPFSPSLKDRTKRIAKELASIHTSLPLNASNSIYVCIDESRCDMLKVMISGPDNTPYENGLFEFDVFFPANYPLNPPKVSFLTTGGGTIRFNPNLYSDGKICLSILGTWEGRVEEKWYGIC